MKSTQKTLRYSRRYVLVLLNLLGLLSLPACLFFSHFFHKMQISSPEYELFGFHFSTLLLSHLFLHFTAAIFIGLIVINFLKDYNEGELMDNFAILKNEIENRYPKAPGFLQYVPVDTGLFIAMKHLNNIDKENGFVYVVGIGKNELEKRMPIVKEYWSKTVNVIQNSNIIYKRITSKRQNDTEFKEHLINCLKLNKKQPDGQVKIKLHDSDFIVSDTFLIIEKNFLFISPTSPKEDDKKIIGQYCFITEDPKIVSQYEKYFDSIWDGHNQISNEIFDEDEFTIKLL